MERPRAPIALPTSAPVLLSLPRFAGHSHHIREASAESCCLNSSHQCSIIYSHSASSRSQEKDRRSYQGQQQEFKVERSGGSIFGRMAQHLVPGGSPLTPDKCLEWKNAVCPP